MKHLIATVLLMMATATGAAAAADAPLTPASTLSGRWVYEPKGSYWSTGDLPTDFSLVIELKFDGDRVVYSSVNDTDKAKIGRLSFTAPLDGTPVALPGQSRYNQVTVKRLGANDFEILQLKDGDVIVGAYWTFLPDGRTLVRRGVGKSPEGKSKAYQEYFRRP